MAETEIGMVIEKNSMKISQKIKKEILYDPLCTHEINLKEIRIGILAEETAP